MVDQPWEIRVRLDDVDGVPQITGLHLDLQPALVEGEDSAGNVVMFQDDPADAVITAERIRRLPLGAIRRAALRVPEIPRRITDPVEGFKATMSTTNPPEALAELPARRPWGDAHYQAVADEYRSAVIRGDPPLVAIGRRWGVGRAMASKYVRRAREMGLLGYPPGPGIAGMTERRSPVNKSTKKQSTAKRRAT